jgi:hypothetical protein
MNPAYTSMNLWFLLGAAVTAIALSGIVLRWCQRQASKLELDTAHAAFGLHAAGSWLSLLLLLHSSADPLWQTLDRTTIMGLTVWDLAKYYAFFVGGAVLCWLMLVRLSYFIHFWVFQERLLLGAVRNNRTGLVLAWAGMLLFLSYLMCFPLVKLFLGFVPYPDLPVFD